MSDATPKNLDLTPIYARLALLGDDGAPTRSEIEKIFPLLNDTDVEAGTVQSMLGALQDYGFNSMYLQVVSEGHGADIGEEKTVRYAQVRQHWFMHEWVRPFFATLNLASMEASLLERFVALNEEANEDWHQHLVQLNDFDVLKEYEKNEIASQDVGTLRYRRIASYLHGGMPEEDTDEQPLPMGDDDDTSGEPEVEAGGRGGGADGNFSASVEDGLVAVHEPGSSTLMVGHQPGANKQTVYDDAALPTTPKAEEAPMSTTADPATPPPAPTPTQTLPTPADLQPAPSAGGKDDDNDELNESFFHDDDEKNVDGQEPAVPAKTPIPAPARTATPAPAPTPAPVAPAVAQPAPAPQVIPEVVPDVHHHHENVVNVPANNVRWWQWMIGGVVAVVAMLLIYLGATSHHPFELNLANVGDVAEVTADGSEEEGDEPSPDATENEDNAEEDGATTDEDGDDGSDAEDSEGGDDAADEDVEDGDESGTPAPTTTRRVAQGVPVRTDLPNNTHMGNAIRAR